MPSSQFLFPSSITVGGTLTATGFVPASPQTYVVSNPSTSRAFDVSSATAGQVAAALGTLIADLRTIGLVL
jgi:hypothetical protein